MAGLANTTTSPDFRQVAITTDRLILRPLRLSDAGLIAHYTSDYRVAEGTRAIPHPLPPGAAESFVVRAMNPDNSEDIWAIDGSAKGLGEILGIVSLTKMEDRRSELSFWVGAGFWNTGFASEAVAGLIADNPHNADTIFAEVFQDNPGSARVLTNCGFTYLGDAECWSVARNAYVPTWTYLYRVGN